jgi:hypothetical protein
MKNYSKQKGVGLVELLLSIAMLTFIIIVVFKYIVPGVVKEEKVESLNNSVDAIYLKKTESISKTTLNVSSNISVSAKIIQEMDHCMNLSSVRMDSLGQNPNKLERVNEAQCSEKFLFKVVAEQNKDVGLSVYEEMQRLGFVVVDPIYVTSAKDIPLEKIKL